tara:strand:- start:123 stop:734 length:612 start_codon:yes stop_codon:yes gene_type:complete
MIVVTGSCRSGTSMAMQTLGLLGVPIGGEAFHEDFPVISGNPKGYYDIPFQEIMDGIDVEKYKDKAIKVLGGCILGLTPQDVSHILVCKRRDTRAQDESTVKLLRKENQIETPSKIRKEFLAGCNKLSPAEIKERRRYHYLYIGMFLSQFKGKVLEVYFEDMFYQPRETIETIKEFLQIDADIDKAVANVGIKEGVVYEELDF